MSQDENMEVFRVALRLARPVGTSRGQATLLLG
jgi:hypothetical protein